MEAEKQPGDLTGYLSAIDDWISRLKLPKERKRKKGLPIPGPESLTTTTPVHSSADFEPFRSF